MTDNPLKTWLAEDKQIVTRPALEWYHMAVEKGLRAHAAAWWAKAVENGEVNADGRTRGAGQ